MAHETRNGLYISRMLTYGLCFCPHKNNEVQYEFLKKFLN